MAKKAQNLRTGIPLIGGSLIDDLNKLGQAADMPDLGTRLATELNRRFTKVNTRQDAQAGLRGSVVIAPQKRRASRGQPPPGMLARGNRIGEVGAALNDDETPNWGQVKSLFTCKRFGGHVSGFEGWFEDCVDLREEMAAMAIDEGEGVIPWFFGWTFDPPNASDVIIADPITNGTIELYSTLVPEGTSTLVQVNYGLTTFAPIFNALGDGSPAGMNIGLYNADLELVTETGLIPVLDTGTDQLTGFFATPLLTEVELAAGEYFQAFATNCCMRMYTIADSAPVTSTMEADASIAGSTLNPGLHFGKAFSPNPSGTSVFVEAFPDTIERTELKVLSGINVPMVMYG